MRAIQIVEETGPDSALALVELDEPEPSHMLTPGSHMSPFDVNMATPKIVSCWRSVRSIFNACATKSAAIVR